MQSADEEDRDRGGEGELDEHRDTRIAGNSLSSLVRKEFQCAHCGKTFLPPKRRMKWSDKIVGVVLGVFCLVVVLVIAFHTGIAASWQASDVGQTCVQAPARTSE